MKRYKSFFKENKKYKFVSFDKFEKNKKLNNNEIAPLENKGFIARDSFGSQRIFVSKEEAIQFATDEFSRHERYIKGSDFFQTVEGYYVTNYYIQNSDDKLFKNLVDTVDYALKIKKNER